MNKTNQSTKLSLDQALARAKKAKNEGDSSSLEKICRAILKYQPENIDAQAMLDDLALNSHDHMGTTEPSTTQLRTLSNFLNSGKLAKLENSLKELQAQFPHSSALVNYEGLVCKAKGNLRIATAKFKSAIKLDPAFTDAYWNLAETQRELRDYKDAIASYDNVLKINPNKADAFHNKGLAQLMVNTPQEAIESLGKAIEIDSKQGSAYANRANAYVMLNQLEKALEDYNKCLLFNPGLAAGYHSRGVVLGKVFEFERAIKDLEKSIKLRPDYSEPYNSLAMLMQNIHRYDKAMDYYDRAIKRDPANMRLQYNRSVCLKSIGEITKADESCRRLLELDPSYAAAHRTITSLKRYSVDDPHIESLKTLVSNPSTNISDKMHLLYGLSKIYEDIGNYNTSYQYLEEANKIRSDQLKYQLNEHKILFDNIKKSFTSTTRPPVKTAEEDPTLRIIFIVGMPRSGTSLVEQILASHSKVYGAGELVFLEDIVDSEIKKKAGLNEQGIYLSFSDEELNSIRNRYLKCIRQLPAEGSVITDKLPLNFQHIGLISLAFPEAKIIHTIRDPIATCWSIYKHYFSTSGNAYAYKFEDLSGFFHLYKDLMSYWHDRLPEKIYDLNYERLTQNQEEETNLLLKACDLEWEDECLTFHKTKRIVTTASSLQVRQQMYTGSSEAWRHFEHHIQPLIKYLSNSV